jgi:hypothetical protein
MKRYLLSTYQPDGEAPPPERLRDALMRGARGSVRSLRRDTREPGEACWLHGSDFCLSTLPVSRQARPVL